MKSSAIRKQETATANEIAAICGLIAYTDGEGKAAAVSAIDAAKILGKIEAGGKAYNLCSPELASALRDLGLADWDYGDYGLVVTRKGRAFVDHFLPDEVNPSLLYNTTATELLVAISNGEIDPVKMARLALAARGLDDRHGQWVGFEQAAKLAKQRNAAD